MSETRSNRSGADETREALVRAGLTLFGRDGFAATSTRAIAAMAGANVASIAYHFGGKEGLRQACAEAVASRISHVAGAAAQFDPNGDPQRAHAFLEGVIDRFIDQIIANPEGRSLSSFILREIGEQGAVFDVLLNRFIAPVHSGLCRVFAAAAGSDPASADTRLAVFALAGQLQYFRIGQPVVLARMGWETIGRAEREQLARTVKANLAGMIAARRERAP